MCGIAALLLHPEQRSLQTWDEIRTIFRRNLEFNESRGADATGLALVRADGQVQIFKAPVRATDFVRLPEYQRLMDGLDDQTTLVLGHTRLPTKGEPDDNRNNHPIVTRYVLGVHNGYIDNDDELFLQFHYPRAAQVDSEIIFRLLDDVAPSRSDDAYLGEVCRRLRLLQGKFTFLAADTRAPYRLMVLKHKNPLCIHYHEAWNALVFSSRYIFLRKAFGRAVITEALTHDQVMLFDARYLTQQGNQPLVYCTLHTDED